MNKCEIEVKVRYSECDSMGVVHHRNYFTWFEMARFAFLEAAGINFHELEKQQILFPVIKAECNYRKSITFDDELIISATLKLNQTARLDFQYRIYEKKSHALMATGATSQAITIPGKGILMKFPDDFREKIENA